MRCGLRGNEQLRRRRTGHKIALRLLGAMIILSSGSAQGHTTEVGSISDVQNDALIIPSDTTASIGSTAQVVSNSQEKVVIGSHVNMNDQLLTGASGRVQVTFVDDTLLSLGENSSVVVDRFVFDPDKGVGEAVLEATKGAFRFTTGRLSGIPNKKITISTPVAQLGVRGTDFWVGPMLGRYGVILLKGELIVRNQGGSVVLKPGQGTFISSRFEAPESPTAWDGGLIKFVLGQTTVHPNQTQQHGTGGGGGGDLQYTSPIFNEGATGTSRGTGGGGGGGDLQSTSPLFNGGVLNLHSTSLFNEGATDTPRVPVNVGASDTSRVLARSVSP